MPIPNFDLRGQLPPGVHKATFDEVRKRFGSTPLVRIKRTQKLAQLIDEVRAFASCIYVDGSYVTDELAPNDVDVILVLPAGFVWAGHEARTVDRVVRYAERNYLEIFPVEKGSPEFNYWVNHFRSDRDSNRKGIVCLEELNDSQ